MLGCIALIGVGQAGVELAKFLNDFLVGFIAVVVMIGGVGLSLVVLGKFMLGPLDAAARERGRPTQFTLADFLALIFLFQLPVAIMRVTVPADAARMTPVWIFAWVASCSMWGLSVRTLSRAGIETPWRRVVFLSAVLPIAYFGSVVFVAALIVGIWATHDQSLRDWLNGWWMLGILTVMPPCFVWAAEFVRRTLDARR